MNATIENWTELACYYGSYFGLSKKKIKGTRKVDDTYELYFLDADNEQDMLYIEHSIYRTFHLFLNADGWRNVFVTKYLSPFERTPAFLLQAQWYGYTLQYHFYIQKDIFIEAHLTNEKDEYMLFDEASEELKGKIKKVHRQIEEYASYRYSNEIQMDTRLYSYIQDSPYNEKVVQGDITLKRLQEEISKQFEKYLAYDEKLKQGFVSYKIIKRNKALFEDAKYATIIWMTLLLINEDEMYEIEEEKVKALTWLKKGYTSSKNKLTDEQRQQIIDEGIDLF